MFDSPDASLELPHLMLLTDDPEGLLIEEIAAHKADYEILYDFDLMKESGHITGYLLTIRRWPMCARC